MVVFFEPYRRDPGPSLGARAARRASAGPGEAALFPPGEGWAYHGSNYIVLRLVVEEATGMGLRDALRQRVFGPLGLSRPIWWNVRCVARARMATWRRTTRSCPAGRGPVDVTELDLPFYRAGGGIVSTAGDVVTMLGAQLRGELLPADLRREMLDRRRVRLGENGPLRMGHRRDHGRLRRRAAFAVRTAWGHLGFSLGYMASRCRARTANGKSWSAPTGHSPRRRPKRRSSTRPAVSCGACTACNGPVTETCDVCRAGGVYRAE